MLCGDYTTPSQHTHRLVGYSQFKEATIALGCISHLRGPRGPGRGTHRKWLCDVVLWEPEHPHLGRDWVSGAPGQKLHL